MAGEWRIGVVIPARNEEAFVGEVISTIPEFVDLVVVIDDGSTDQTFNIAQDASCSTEKKVVRTSGLGVGGAIDIGHQALMESLEKPFISVVMAGDGQMNPEEISTVIQPILDGKANHVKGNRTIHQNGLNGMPKDRKFATKLLSVFTTIAAGQSISDPQCGFTATSSTILQRWDWDSSWKAYGYPNYWLVNLALIGARIVEVPVQSIYAGQKSGIRRLSFFYRVGIMLAIQHHRRAWRFLFQKQTWVWSWCAFVMYVLGWSALLSQIVEGAHWVERPTGFFMLTVMWISAWLMDRKATKQRRKSDETI